MIRFVLFGVAAIFLAVIVWGLLMLAATLIALVFAVGALSGLWRFQPRSGEWEPEAQLSPRIAQDDQGPDSQITVPKASTRRA